MTIVNENIAARFRRKRRAANVQDPSVPDFI
jgi:hypothetical protein